MLILALALACCAPLQETAPDPQARIAELIESSNQLPGFRAQYVMSRDGEREGVIELRYRAPDRLVIINRSANGNLAGIGIVGDQLWMDSLNATVGPMAGSVDLTDVGGSFEEAFAILREAFPRPGGQAKVNVRFKWGVNADSDKTEFDLQVSYVRTGVSLLLGWLTTMQRMPGQLGLADGILTHDSERVHAEVDARTGFLTRIDMTGADASTRSMVLESLELDGELDGELTDELFARPEPAEGARDISPELRQQLLSPPNVRNESLLHIDALLRLGERSWDETFTSDLRRFLAAMHRSVFEANMERWVQGVREGISEFAVELSDRLKAGGERSECEQAIAARRADLAASLDETRAKMLEGLAAGPRNDDPSAHWQELRELEDQVLGDLFDQGPASQLLRTFDSDTAAALGG